uniref:Uncharacterized protein n=1 Tax=Skeletonema marinoi TaxID=267567 RepID=A0A7S2M6J0_9STRA|mmetsp:Transcript_4563/g.7835  ORF Transcript_4563/g.7835 Transcript_4563/m.7835 type:complete len:256 (+) Transcript_4563:198-965(+)
MPTLILKRIRIASPLLPKPSEAPKTETATALQIPQNDNLTALIHHDKAALVYRDTAARTAKINEKFPSAPSDSIPSQPMTSIIDTSDGTAGSMNSNERNTHPERKRKSSELVIKRMSCSAEGSTNVDVAQNGRTWRHEEKAIKRCGRERRVHRSHGQQAKQQRSSERCAGLCIKPGEKRKACSSDGCTNNIVKGGVCVRSGGHVKRGVRKDAQIKLVREERVLGMGHGRIFTPKRCSRVGFTDVLGMGHGRMFIP